MAKDDSLPSEPPTFFPNIFGELATNEPIVDHSQDTPDVGPSFDNGEDKLFIKHPLDL